MSWRIEQADALTLLRELPDGWAQTCVTRPPRTGDRTLAILAEVRRVLRDDGTLWLLFAPDQVPLTAELHAAGWTQQSPPTWATPFIGERAPAMGPFLFTKEPRHFYDAHTIGARSRPSSPFCVSASRQVRRAQSCVPAREQERRLQLVKRCILAGSAPLACGECGAPYRRTRPGESGPGIRRPTCPHNNPGGYCLVLDPFYDRAGIPTAEAALCTGRNFLGIANPAGVGENR